MTQWKIDAILLTCRLCSSLIFLTWSPPLSAACIAATSNSFKDTVLLSCLDTKPVGKNIGRIYKHISISTAIINTVPVFENWYLPTSILSFSSIIWLTYWCYGFTISNLFNLFCWILNACSKFLLNTKYINKNCLT